MREDLIEENRKKRVGKEGEEKPGEKGESLEVATESVGEGVSTSLF